MARTQLSHFRFYGRKWTIAPERCLRCSGVPTAAIVGPTSGKSSAALQRFSALRRTPYTLVAAMDDTDIRILVQLTGDDRFIQLVMLQGARFWPETITALGRPGSSATTLRQVCGFDESAIAAELGGRAGCRDRPAG